MEYRGAQRSSFPLGAGQIAVLLALLLLPLVYWPGVQYVYQSPKVFVFRAAVVVVLVSGALHLLRRGARVRVRSLDLLLVAFLGWMGLAAALSAWPETSLLGLPGRFEGWLAFVGYVAFYAVTSRSRPRYLYLAALTLALTGGVVGLLAIFEAVGWFEPVGSGVFGDRAVATLGNPLYLGSFLCLAFPLTLGLFLLVEGGLRFAILASFGLQVAGLYLSLGRGAWVGAITGVAVTVASVLWAIGHAGGRSRVATAEQADGVGRRVGISGGLVLATVAFGVLVGWAVQPDEGADGGVARVTQAVQVGVGTTRTRLIMWDATLSLVADRPVFGWGPDTYSAEFPAKRTVEFARLEGAEGYPDRPHDHWLYLAYAGGLPALLLYLAYLVTLVWRAESALRHSGDRGRKIAIAAALGAFVGYEVQSLFSFSVVEVTPIALAVQGALVALTVSRRSVQQVGWRSWPWRTWTFGGLAPAVVGVVLVGLAVLFVLEGVRQPLADRAYGQAQKQLQRGLDPEAALSRAMSLSPRDPLYAVTLGQFLQGSAGRLDDAAATYARGQEGTPWDPRLEYYRATVYETGGQVDRAADLYREILSRDPLHVGALYQLGRIELSRSRYAEAARLLGLQTDVQPGDPKAWSALGRAREGLGDKAGAVRAYQQALTIDPQDAETRSWLEALQ